jgi:putative ABC transport system permease protein
MNTHWDVGQWLAISAVLLMLGVLAARWAASQGLDSKRLAQSLRADW